MPYEQSHQIEERFRRAVDVIANEGVSAGQLATVLGVSRPTVHRIITELKRRGYALRSVREDHGWRYELVSEPSANRKTYSV